MKTTISLLICVMVSALCCADIAQVANPGFESMFGDPLLPESWTTYKGTGATVYFAAKTDVVYDGTYSFKIAAREGYGMIYQEITSGFTSGQTYSLWLYGRGDANGNWKIDEPGDRIELYVKFKDAGGGTIDEPMMIIFDGDPETDAPILSESEWLQSPAMRFTVPDGTASMLIKILSVDSSVDGNLGDGTSIYIDNVSLDILPLPTQNPTPENGAIEQDASEVYLSWQPGDDPYSVGTPDPEITGYYVYVDQHNDSDEVTEPNFITPVYVTGTQYPATAPGISFGTDQVVYWRVDTSRNGTAADDPNTVTGETWSFRTESSFPEIITQPQDTAVFEGESAALTVDVTGVNPITLYEWFDSNDVLVDSGATLNTLSFSDTVIEDSDAYYCVITNNQGKSTQSDSAQLYVMGVLAQYDFENDLTDATGRFDGIAMNADPNETGVVSYDAAGIDGTALQLDGENYVQLPAGAYPNPYMGLANGTIICWVKTTGLESETIIGAYNDGSTTCYNLSVQSGERLYFSIRTDTGNILQIQVSAPGINDGNWHQLAATYALGESAAVYMDGEQLTTAGGLPVSAEFAPWTYSLPIGAGDTRGLINNVCTGSIDSMILYNYVKTEKEILDAYNALVAEEKSLCLDEYASMFDVAGPEGVGAEYADCRVDLYDFAALAGSWLDCGLYPACSQ